MTNLVKIIKILLLIINFFVRPITYMHFYISEYIITNQKFKYIGKSL